METRLAQIAEVGSPAPEIELAATGGGTLRLSDFKGRKNVLLVFYPADFSPVCSNQLPAIEEQKADLDQLQTQVLGISVDSRWAHEAFAKQLGISFPLLADVHRVAARAYGVLRESEGNSERALFIVDQKGILRYRHVHDIREVPALDEALRVLHSLS